TVRLEWGGDVDELAERVAVYREAGATRVAVHRGEHERVSERMAALARAPGRCAQGQERRHPPSRSDAVPCCRTQSAPGGTPSPNVLIRGEMLYPLSYGRLAADLAGGPQSVLPPRGERREPGVVGCATPGSATGPD